MPITRPMQGQTGTPQGLLVPVYTGEVLTAYNTHRLFGPLVRQVSITSGTEARFPATWKIGSEIHQPGAELLGTPVETHKYSIYLDSRPRVAHFELDDIDTILAQFETRSEFSFQAGEELANQDDKNTVKLLVKASRTAATGVFPGGGIDQNGTAYTNAAFANEDAAAAQALLDAIDEIVIKWDETNVPFAQRYCVIKPRLWHQIRKLGTLVTGITAGTVPLFGHADIDSVNPQRQRGMDRSEYLMWNGVMIFRSTNLPNGINDSSNPETNYAADYTKTRGIMWQSDAVGHVTKLGIDTETFRDVRRQSDFIVSKLFTGGGTLRPMCAVEIAIP